MRAKYVRVSQRLLEKFPGCRPKNVVDLLLKREETELFGDTVFADTKPLLSWGSVIYEVRDDDSLVLVESKFDTSG